jgi:hypothetical protein
MVDQRVAHIRKGQLSQLGERSLNADLASLGLFQQLAHARLVHQGGVAIRPPADNGQPRAVVFCRPACFSPRVPAPLAPLIGLLIGLWFAWSASEVLAKAPGSGITSRALLVVILFSLLVFAPATSYFLAFAPDWSYAYFIDTERLPSAVDLSLVLVNAASVPSGFVWGSRAARARSLPRLAKLSFPPGILALVFLAVAMQRLGIEASYAQFHGDFGTRPIPGSPLGYAILWMWAVLLFSILWISRWLTRFGDRRQQVRIS